MRNTRMKKYKQITLSELEEMLGKDHVERLFLEYYLTLIGKNKEHFGIADGLELENIMN